MERFKSPILSLVLFFGSFQVQAMPAGQPQDYSIRTKYSCAANGVTLRNKNTLVSDGTTLEDIVFTTKPGGVQSLSIGDGQYLIWPRVKAGSFEKSVNLLSRHNDEKYRIVQEVELRDSQKTKSNLSMTLKDRLGIERVVSCRVEMEWMKKSQ